MGEFIYSSQQIRGFPGSSDGKEPACNVGSIPAWVQSLGWEVLLRKGMATSSILAWKTPWTEEPGGLQSTGSQRVEHD